ncbi:MAG: tellurite resistance TerB family protein [Hyphomicrobiaceae bacterium]
MLDAKTILDMMMKGAGAQQRPTAAPGGLGGLGELLNQLGGTGPEGATPRAQPQAGGGNGLEDLLRNMLGPQASAQNAPQGQPSPNAGGFSLDDLFRQMAPQSEAQTPTSGAPSTPQPDGGSLLDMLGKVLRDAGQGTKDGAGQIAQNPQVRDMVEKMSGGRSPEELMRQLQDFIANNKVGAGAALGGLGALVLGTRTGRSVAVSAAKLGALALIGGLAYRAYQNYSAGRAPTAESGAQTEAAPSGSGFEEGAVTNDAAITYIRAMIAAAAADGRIDAQEQSRIVANLSHAGLDREAEEFIAREMARPATADELARSISGQREAIQLYTAARLAIEPDTAAEQAFLADLANRLGIDQRLAAHIDATARSVAG